MARLRAGHARPLRGGNGEKLRQSQGPSRPLRPRKLGQLPTAWGAFLRADARDKSRGFGGTPEFKVEEGAGALRTKSNTAFV